MQAAPWPERGVGERISATLDVLASRGYNPTVERLATMLLGGTVEAARLRDALEGLAGITCINDVTARDLQKTDNQWTRAKGFDTFCPVGPRVVPLADLGTWQELEVICRVNGSERQHGRAADMAFGIPEIIAYISRIMTLEPGDLVATGSPAGVGPLAAGDVVEVEIPGIGVLRNAVTAGK